jgi:polyhydroxyalkanoate synthesis regulator phasin
MSMLFGPKKELVEKHTHIPFKVLVELDQLETEEELLNQKKKELMEAEKKLLARISNILYFRRQRNKDLREDVELLERNCRELTEFLRSYIKYYAEP